MARIALWSFVSIGLEGQKGETCGGSYTNGCHCEGRDWVIRVARSK